MVIILKGDSVQFLYKKMIDLYHPIVKLVIVFLF